MIESLPPFRWVVSIAIDMPDMADAFFVQVGVEVLADADQAIFIAARQKKELQLL